MSERATLSPARLREAVELLELMAEDDGSVWGLSAHDQDAIRTVLRALAAAPAAGEGTDAQPPTVGEAEIEGTHELDRGGPSNTPNKAGAAECAGFKPALDPSKYRRSRWARVGDRLDDLIWGPIWFLAWILQRLPYELRLRKWRRLEEFDADSPGWGQSIVAQYSTWDSRENWASLWERKAEETSEEKPEVHP